MLLNSCWSRRFRIDCPRLIPPAPNHNGTQVGRRKFVAGGSSDDKIIGDYLFRFCISGWLLAAEPVRSARRLLPMPELQADPRIPTLKKVVGHEWGQGHYQLRGNGAISEGVGQGGSGPRRPGSLRQDVRRTHAVLPGHRQPDHLQRREEIRAANLQLADPRSLPPEKARELAAQVPALVWLAYGIHGNETSGPEAALLTAYHLLADRRPQTRKLLDDAIVLIDPLQNPDGHERFVNVYRETRGPYPDPQPLATEHTERWPSGRFNHYLFDMNRDWFLQSQRESQAKVAAYLRMAASGLRGRPRNGPQRYVLLQSQSRAGQSLLSPPADRVAGPTRPAACPAF